ncbi:MAG: NAD-dependent epimerase/dehydratase family protein [Candidatus Dormiibacterota bacterium]
MGDPAQATDVTGNTEKDPTMPLVEAEAIGTPPVPKLIDRGHHVIGTYRSSPEKAEQPRALRAEAIAADLLDAAAVRKALVDARPEAVVHEAMALADGSFSRKLDKTFAQTNRLRIEGTDALPTAAREARIHRLVAQSFDPYRYAREGGMVKTEEDPLEPATPNGLAMVADGPEASPAFPGAQPSRPLSWLPEYIQRGENWGSEAELRSERSSPWIAHSWSRSQRFVRKWSPVVRSQPMDTAT